jgi:TRAP-type C4-dicarboxylate transport system permease small subunit
VGVLAACERVLRAVLAAIMLLLIVVNFANVVGRYVFSAPIRPADELMTYAMVWGVFLGAAVASLRGGHLTMDAAVSMLSPFAQRVLRTAGGVVLVVVLLYVAASSLEFIDILTQVGQRSMAAEIPMAVPHAAVPIGFALMAAFTVVRLVRDWRRPGAAP